MTSSKARSSAHSSPTMSASTATSTSRLLAADVARGLGESPKSLPSKYLYDAEGSRLFESICALPEYYLTRTELALMRAQLPSIADALGPDVRLVEYGCGAGIKTRLLLRSLCRPAGYVPIDVSETALASSVARIRKELPHLEVLPLRADITRPHSLPLMRHAAARTVMYFPGSTLGNFAEDDAVALLSQMHDEMGSGGAALIGIDLKKSPEIIERAYNDAAGVTARFTLNILTRINRELGADFVLTHFRHRAAYEPTLGRIETHVVSTRDQIVRIAGERYCFERDEKMLVEISTKYDLADMHGLSARAGLRLTRSWTDVDGWFALVLLERDSRVQVG